MAFEYEPFCEFVLSGTAEPGSLLDALEGEGDGFGSLLPLAVVCRYGGGGRFSFWLWGRGLLATTVAMAGGKRPRLYV